MRESIREMNNKFTSKLFKILLLLVAIKISNSYAYMETAKLVGGSFAVDFYIYTGSIKRTPDNSVNDYWASGLINYKVSQKDGTLSVFRNTTFHCSESDKKMITTHVDAGHSQLWAEGNITYNTSEYVGKKLNSQPGGISALAFDFVCGTVNESRGSNKTAAPVTVLPAANGPSNNRACDPNVHPDNWNNCYIEGSNAMRYRGVSAEVEKRLDRSLKIADVYPLWTLHFINGVVAWNGLDKIDLSKYNEAELARLSGNFALANSIDAKNLIKAAKDKLETEKKMLEYLNKLSKQCRGRPPVENSVLEKLSNSLQVNPSLIELNRLDFQAQAYSCNAVFRHSRGTTNCSVDFNDYGRISGIYLCK